VTFRSFAISIFLLLAVCVAIAFTDHASSLVLLTGANHLPQVVVFVIVVFMLVVNPLLRLVNAKWVFSQCEMIVIWCVMAAGVGVPAFGLVHYIAAVHGGAVLLHRKPGPVGGVLRAYPRLAGAVERPQQRRRYDVLRGRRRQSLGSSGWSMSG